jgi:hypothetical protein
MTAARQEMKAIRLFLAFPIARSVQLLGLVLGLAALSVTLAGRSNAATTERVVSDANTGLAISGVDPVGYFTDARPIAGKATIELSFGGVVWRFLNIGNRTAFLAHPEVYAPRFGGYDPVDLARGKIVESNASLWLIVDQRLYLFASDANRTAFAGNSGHFVEAAVRRWIVLRDSLAQ